MLRILQRAMGSKLGSEMVASTLAAIVSFWAGVFLWLLAILLVEPAYAKRLLESVGF